MDLDNRELSYLLSEVFSSCKGKELLLYLESQYLLRSSVKSTVEATYYELGQKELVQNLLSLMKSKEHLDISVVTDV